MAFIRIARLDEIGPGFRRVVRTPLGEVLALEADGQVFLLDNQCPHQGFPLAKGSVTGNAIICPRHGFRFQLASGECAQAPACRVRRFSVAYDGAWLGLDVP